MPVRCKTLMTIKEKREFHISFCRVCKNRKLNFEKGVLCNLTGKIADFKEDGCEKYEQDEIEKKTCKISIQKTLKDSYPETNLMNDLLSRKSYKSHEKINIKSLEIKNEKKIVETDKLGFISAFLFALAIFLYNIYLHIEKIKTFEKEVIFLIITGVLIISLIGYFAFFKKFKNNEILIDDMKVKFSKYSLFDEYTSLSIYWNEIADFGILTTPHKNGNIEEILVKTYSGKEILVHPKTYNISTKYLLEILKNRSK